MATPQQLKDQASSVAGIYSDLQDEILKQIIKRLNDGGLDKIDHDNVLNWQMQKLAELDKVNADTIKQIVKATKMGNSQLAKLINVIRDTAVDTADNGLGQATGLNKQPMTEVDTVMKGLTDQTMGDLNNNVNQKLISQNFKDTAQAQAYTDIVNKTTAKVVTGLKSPQQALTDTVYQWQNQGGLKSGFVDKGGHHWTLQGYANTLINTTVPRTYGAVTKQRMDDYDYHLILYPAHPTAREACAPIQGKVVNMVPESDPAYDPKYDTVYNHGYGTAGGALGINCSHWTFTVFIPGVSTNNLHPVDPDTAIANAKIQQDQRRMERAIRQSKSKLQAAEELGDQDGIKHFKLQIRNQQSAVRQLVKKHDFLSREYSREKVIDNPIVNKVPKPAIKQSVESSPLSEAAESISKTNMKSAVGEDNYNEFVAHLKTLKDPQLQELFSKRSSLISFSKLKDVRAFARGTEVQAAQESFDGNKYMAPLQAVYHEAGHAFDAAGVQEIYGKETVETGHTKKIKSFEIPEYANHVSALDKYHLKDSILSDMWKTVNGDLKTYDELGPKPRKKADKVKWQDERVNIFTASQNNFDEFLNKYANKAKGDPRRFGALSDIMESTGYFSRDYPLGIGHGKKYWKNVGTTETEFIAHMTESIAANKEALTLLGKMFPNAVKSYRAIIDDIIKGGK